MTASEDLHFVANLANHLASEIAEFSMPQRQDDSGTEDSVSVPALSPQDEVLAEYDRRVTDGDLRAATRSRFASTHYADAVESGVKALNDCVRKRSGLSEDGDALMTAAFSANSPKLRINRGRSKSDESAQRGHMHLCQGVVGAWRNPRAHSLVDDLPSRALMMLETLNDLIVVTKSAVRTRKPKKP